MKVMLLNDGGYGDMENVAFPVEVEADFWSTELVYIYSSELYRVGAKPKAFGGEAWAFCVGEHVRLPQK